VPNVKITTERKYILLDNLASHFPIKLKKKIIKIILFMLIIKITIKIKQIRENITKEEH
jgi:hypothetical protein